MDPLSGLQSLAARTGQMSPLGNANLASAGVKNIPFSEIEKISPSTLPLPSQEIAPGGQPAQFDNLLKNLVHDVSEKQAASSDAVNGLISGQNVSLHQAMIAMEEASVSFQLMVEVRNKVLESYQELMRMQI